MAIPAFAPPRKDERICLRITRAMLNNLQQVAAQSDAPPATVARVLLEQSLEHHLAGA